MAATGSLNSLNTLVRRLEAATALLENIASSSKSSTKPFDETKDQLASPSSQPTINGDAKLPSHPSLDTVVQPAAVVAFDSILNDDLKPFADLSEQLDGLVAEQGAAFCVAFKAQRDVLLIASKAREPEPTSSAFMHILKDLQHGIEMVNNVREHNRKCPQENHLAMLADGVSMLAWVTIKPQPDQYVAEVLGGAQVYGNKVLLAFKEKEPINVDWVRAFVKLAGALKTFIKQHFPKGLEWNPNGIDAEEAQKELVTGSPSSSSTAALEASRGGAPPPPPPPLPQFDAGGPPPPPPPPGAPKPAASNDMSAIFDQLNRGESVTSGLRKVDKSEMTHKNPALRGSSAVSSAASATANTSASSAKSSAAAISRPPRKELDGNKWSIENYENTTAPITVDAERQQSILITRCNNATIRVNGKANAISIDNCSRLDLIFDSLVSSVGAVGCKNFRMQVTGNLPSVQLDKVDGAVIYLSHDSMGTEIYTSMCSGVNVTLPAKSEQEDSVEVPLPEQIRSWIENGRLMSEIVKQEG